MNVASAMPSATQRPALMPRSPNASTSRPPAMGSQVRNERSGNPCMLIRVLGIWLVIGSGARHEPAEHDGEPDDHPERIGIKEAALHPAHDAGEEADGVRRAVHGD